MSVLFIPVMGKLFVDKLSMTIDFSEKEKKVVADNFKEVLSQFPKGNIYQSKMYMYNKNLDVDSVNSIMFQCTPRFKNMRFFRIEYNPSKIDPSEVAPIVNLVLPGGYKDLIAYGHISRIDIAVDCKYLPIGKLYFHYPNLSVCSNKLKSSSIQTAYLGDKEGVSHLSIYDKKAEMKHKNNKLGNKIKEEVPPYPLTRIEWKFHPKELCTFKALSQVENYFSKLKLVMLTGQPKMPTNDLEALVKLVFKLSKYEGLPQALLNLPKFRKQAIAEHIMKLGKSDWWKPEKLWESFPAALEPIINPVMPWSYLKEAKKSNET